MSGGHTPAEVRDHRRAFEVCALVVCLLATGALFGLGLWLLTIGRMAGWVAIGLAAGTGTLVALVGLQLEEDR